MDEPREQGPGASEIDAFARALAGLAPDIAIDALLDKGSRRPRPAAWLRREVFAPAARRLGDWWVSDEICFATVTLGMAQLQRLAWTHGRAAFPAAPPVRLPVLLAPLTGEQHTFGLNMLVEDLRERGFEAALLPCPTREALLSAAASGLFSAMGLSVGSDAVAAEVAPLVQALRRAAPGRLAILLGGPVAATLDAAACGADEVVAGERAVERLCAMASQGAAARAAA